MVRQAVKSIGGVEGTFRMVFLDDETEDALLAAAAEAMQLAPAALYVLGRQKALTERSVAQLMARTERPQRAEARSMGPTREHDSMGVTLDDAIVRMGLETVLPPAEGPEGESIRRAIRRGVQSAEQGVHGRHRKYRGGEELAALEAGINRAALATPVRIFVWDSELRSKSSDGDARDLEEHLRTVARQSNPRSNVRVNHRLSLPAFLAELSGDWDLVRRAELAHGHLSKAQGQPPPASLVLPGHGHFKPLPKDAAERLLLPAASWPALGNGISAWEHGGAELDRLVAGKITAQEIP